jgi:hypothetical protein
MIEQGHSEFWQNWEKARAIGLSGLSQGGFGIAGVLHPYAEAGSRHGEGHAQRVAIAARAGVVLCTRGILEPALGITAHAVTSEANLSYEREVQLALDAVDQGAR